MTPADRREVERMIATAVAKALAPMAQGFYRVNPSTGKAVFATEGAPHVAIVLGGEQGPGLVVTDDEPMQLVVLAAGSRVDEDGDPDVSAYLLGDVAPDNAAIYNEPPVPAPDGVTSVFALVEDYDPESLIVYLSFTGGAARVALTRDTTLTDGHDRTAVAQFTLYQGGVAYAPPAGASMRCFYRRAS